jgi:hypothetical protein
MADTPDAPFVMHGARAAIAGGMVHIEEQVTGIEHAVTESPGLAFDLAKTLIESVCRTVLTERTISFEHDDDLPKLFKTVTNALPFLPASVSGEVEVRKSLARTLSGLHVAIQGISELRNHCGFASHGSSGPRPAMESVQAFLAAEAADTIVGFLYRIHRQDRTPSESVQLTYYDNPDFNDYVDDTHGLIKIFETEFKPSEVLFQMELETYRVYLTEYEPEVAEDEPDSGEKGAEETAP